MRQPKSRFSSASEQPTLAGNMLLRVPRTWMECGLAQEPCPTFHFPCSLRSRCDWLPKHQVVMAPIALHINPGKYKQAYAYISAQPSISSPARAKRPSGGSPTDVRTTIQRSASNSSDDRRQSLKLTVKAAPSKLREVMRVNEVDSLQDTLGGGQVIDGPRRRRNQPPPRVSARARRTKYAEYGESDIDEDEDVEEREEEDDFSKVGAEAEGGTDDENEDVEMEDAPFPPKPAKITLKPPAKVDTKSPPKPKLIITPANVGPVKSVEDQEIQDDPGDEEVEDSSDLSGSGDDEDEDSDDEEEAGEQTKVNEEDAEGEEDAQGEDEELEEDDEGDIDDSSDETPASGAATPDPDKLTKRQRARGDDSGVLMALDMAPQQRKVRLTTSSRNLANAPSVLHRRRKGDEEGRACSEAERADQAEDTGREECCSQPTGRP